MKIVFVIPVYNDWDSLKVLSRQIKEVFIKEKWNEAELVIVNDSSTLDLDTSLKPFALKSTILNLSSNQGNQKAITIGLSYINEKITDYDYDYVVVMDADGEDKPSDIVRLVNEAKKNERKKIVFTERAKRNEGFFYILFYTIYKILFKLLTGEKIGLGQFSCIPKNLLPKVLGIPSIWAHYVAGLIKSKLPFKTVVCDKGQRIKGNTNQNYYMLLIHGFAAMAVYMDIIILRFILISVLGMVLTIVSIGIVFYLKFFTTLTTFDWATNMTIGLAIIFIILLLTFFLSLLSLLNKNSSSNLISKNTYKHFILSEKKYT